MTGASALAISSSGPRLSNSDAIVQGSDCDRRRRLRILVTRQNNAAQHKGNMIMMMMMMMMIFSESSIDCLSDLLALFMHAQALLPRRRHLRCISLTHHLRRHHHALGLDPAPACRDSAGESGDRHRKQHRDRQGSRRRAVRSRCGKGRGGNLELMICETWNKNDNDCRAGSSIQVPR